MSHFSLLTTIILYNTMRILQPGSSLLGVNHLGCFGLVHRHIKCGKFVKTPPPPPPPLPPPLITYLKTLLIDK